MEAYSIELDNIESFEYCNVDTVYDITVKNEHCYYIEGMGKVLVHNSGKTYGTMQNLVLYAIEYPGTRISCVSRSLPHVKKGLFRDFQQLLKQGVTQLGEMRWTDFTFHFENGSYIEFFGLEDPDKAHGPGRDILFINEANFVPKAVFDQLAMRTTGKILLDLNPSEFNSWVYDIADNPANLNIHSTYKDNIANLSPQQVAFIEAYQHLPDPFMWQVYGLGLRGASEAIIFRFFELVDGLPGKGEIIYGLDFGFNNPNAMVRCEVYDGDVYVEEMLYQSNLTKGELEEFMKTIDFGSNYIYADAAEPDSIEQLYRAGFNIHPSNKDVWNGIMTLKSKRLFIKRTSSNLLSELRSYKWKVDKNDVIKEEPEKLNDHLIDAMRYAVHTYFTKPQPVLIGW